MAKFNQSWYSTLENKPQPGIYWSFTRVLSTWTGTGREKKTTKFYATKAGESQVFQGDECILWAQSVCTSKPEPISAKRWLSDKKGKAYCQINTRGENKWQVERDDWNIEKNSLQKPSRGMDGWTAERQHWWTTWYQT